MTTVEVRTTRLGDRDAYHVAEEAVLTFPDGLPGFETHTSFALIDDDALDPFHWLQSMHDPHIGFLVIEPSAFITDYEFDISDADVELLGLGGPTVPRVLTILLVPGDVKKMTANLQAPLVIHPHRRIGKQIILTDERFSLRHPVFGAPRRQRSTRLRAC